MYLPNTNSIGYKGVKSLILLIILTLAVPCFAQTAESGINEQVSAIEGTWSIDLRPTADATAYLKEFKIKLTANSTFKGEFYDTKFNNGLLNSNWEKLYFAFSTSDQSNIYFHLGYLLNGKLYGATYCPNRDFVAPWTGSKKTE